MKYLSLFSGIGGFELGIQKAYESISKTKGKQQGRNKENLSGDGKELLGAECIGYSEIDKYAIQVYNKHFKHKNYGDATKIDTRQLPDFDLLVGGFPCQAFSIAGKRRGFDEARGTLFFDIARILADKKPRHFILENVKGLLSHDGGNTFTTIIRILSSMGYFVEWQVLNAKDFGVPQNRERVFIVGHLGGQPRRKVFPIGECNTKVVGKTILDINQAQRVYGTEGLAITQKALGGGQGAKTGLYAVLTPDRPIKRQNGRRFKEDGEPSFTLTKTDVHGVAIANCLDAHYYKGNPISKNRHTPRTEIKDGMRIRRLTPLECERLMAYPDNWTAEGTEGKISDTQRYKMCGNGIVSNVVEEVVKRLI